ncbi:putative Peptidyl-prolyl cis-trans isomerase, cyclophilin family [Planktothrix serta PCC 8927]|uniref:peptidylprolyl isomerase n=1 Tax=Planktothrix serta PCC 8927 TaxID=671068 RepID=A0A7Z9DXP0_9CYAN|nr:peptidylprolyl isomerase [Planktothrix serta]VXD14908.1 putative Peptidyl-prolyl cis-trans isomerase, cyclophilin family [Planktothrix serta PCC 8927]
MADLPELNSSATVIMVVDGLPITIQVDGANAPITAGNFVDLVERDVYDNTTFHRVVLEPQPFVVQGGDPQSQDPNVDPNTLGSGGFIDPATGQVRNIPLEIKPQGATEPLYSQTFQQAGITVPPVLSNVVGSIAMARSNAGTDTASSQFYFNLANSTSLDGNYAVFGTVSQGFDVVNQVQQGDRLWDAEVVDGIIPSRVSGIISDANILNGFINTINLSTLPLSYAYPRDFDADNVLTLTPDITQNNPRGLLAGGGNDQITGSTGNDVINGNQGNDSLNGDAGNDYILGGQDNDSITGGQGNDILDGNKGNDIIFGGAGSDFIRGGQGNDSLNGNEGNDFLIGDLGTDSLTGEGGADIFMLRGDEAATVFDVNLADIITDFSVAEGDKIHIIDTIPLANLSFTSSGNDTVIQVANSGILGVVKNVQPSVVQTGIVITPPTDLALTIG